jgi:hypothetical protein
MVCNDGELPMSWIEVTVKGETAYLRANCVSGILPDTSRKTGAVIYCDPPIECLAVDESVVDVYAMLYEELEEDEDDDITDEQYSDIIESYQAIRAAEQDNDYTNRSC